MDESRQWVEFGRWLVEQREERGLRRREAAKRAKVPETTWRDLETGRKKSIGGIRLLPNPSNEVLERVAGALELPLEDVLARVGSAAGGSGRNTAGRAGTSRSANGRGRSDGDDGASSGGDPGELDEAGIVAKLRRLSERDRDLVVQLVDSMLQRTEA